MEVVVPHGFCLLDRGFPGFPCVWIVGGSLSPVECRVQGFPRGALSACDSGGLEESLRTSLGVFRVSLWGVGLGRHEDPVCPVKDPPSSLRFEDVDGGMLGGSVEGVPPCDGYFYPGRVELWGGPAT